MALAEMLKANSYPGRGIIMGLSEDGNHAVAAYFIMGRSVNSRNRVFVEDGTGLRTKAYDVAKVTDPSLIIYAPVRVYGDKVIVSNGDQTDTMYDYMVAGKSWRQALCTREYEPDAPNYTPRIAGLLDCEGGKLTYHLSILKREYEQCIREFYMYDAPEAGIGHIIHTYQGDGDPLPSFMGDPRLVDIEGGIREFTNTIWNSLNEENRVSLWVRYVDLNTGFMVSTVTNRHV